MNQSIDINNNIATIHCTSDDMEHHASYMTDTYSNISLPNNSMITIEGDGCYVDLYKPDGSVDSFTGNMTIPNNNYQGIGVRKVQLQAPVKEEFRIGGFSIGIFGLLFLIILIIIIWKLLK